MSPIELLEQVESELRSYGAARPFHSAPRTTHLQAVWDSLRRLRAALAKPAPEAPPLANRPIGGVRGLQPAPELEAACSYAEEVIRQIDAGKVPAESHAEWIKRACLTLGAALAAIRAKPAPEADAAEGVAQALERRADLYEKNGEPGELGFNFWGWRDFAKALRKEAVAARSRHPIAGYAPEADAAGEVAKLREQRVHLLAELANLRATARAHGVPSIKLGMTAGELIARQEAHPAPQVVIDALRAAAELRRPDETK